MPNRRQSAGLPNRANQGESLWFLCVEIPLRQISQKAKLENAVPQQQAPTSTGDVDTDRILEGENEPGEELYSSTEYLADPNALIWHGKLMLYENLWFNSIAAHVAGANIHQLHHWAMPEVVHVDGRIRIGRANEYLCGLHGSQTKNVSVVAVRPIDEQGNQAAFDKIFQYYIDRERYGRIGYTPVEGLDAYLIPVEAGATKLPDLLDTLVECNIQAPVTERMLLIAFVIRKNNQVPPTYNTEH
ncbi:MAG: hypothetical protein Q9170_005750 [Blastenia crenularia]